MTVTVDQARNLIRGCGIRCTSSRLAVLRHLGRAPRPVTHAEVATSLVPLGFDKSTIYRALVEMSEAGLVSRLDLGDHTWRFELRSTTPDNESAHHPHFMCLDCGKVTCLPQAVIQLSGESRRGYATPGTVTEVLLKGHCDECV